MGGAEECRTDTGYSENILQVCIHLSTLKDIYWNKIVIKQNSAQPESKDPHPTPSQKQINPKTTTKS